VAPGGDPLAARGPTGPWSWNLVPAAGSAQTLVLVDNGGLAVRRIDDRRAQGAVTAGRVHVVPIATHLVVDGSRTLAWGTAGGGCTGHTTTDKSELDVAVGVGLELFEPGDGACERPITQPVTLTRSTALAVVGLPAADGGIALVTLPLG
jgi:hypothetical protein